MKQSILKKSLPGRQAGALTLTVCSALLLLNGCFGEYMADQYVKEKNRPDEIKQENEQRKAAGLEPLPPEKPRDILPASDINTIAMLSVDRPEGEPVDIINVFSLLAVTGGGTSPTVTFDKSYFLTRLLTYHYSEARNIPAGTIALKDASGKTYGPWQAKLDSGVYWVADPETTVPAGVYTVIDSDPSTWSQNAETGGAGITTGKGIPAK